MKRVILETPVVHLVLKYLHQAMKTFRYSSLVIFLLMSLSLFAQESQEQLSQQAANPLADLISLPFQNNLNMNYGPYNRNLNDLNIQPVFPFGLKNGTIITRTILPFMNIPDFNSESGKYSSGLGDIVFTAFYAPKGKITWGIGPVIELPYWGKYAGHTKMERWPFCCAACSAW